MVELFALTSGALIAGISVYRYLTQGTESVSPVYAGASGSTTQQPLSQSDAGQENFQERLASPQSHTETTGLIPHTQEQREALQRGIYCSTVSLGLASTGFMFFPILRFASVPALLYMGAPSARDAYDQLYEYGRPSQALAETAVLAVCLGGGWYLVGSLGFLLYYLARMQLYQRNFAHGLHPTEWAIPQSVRLQRGVIEEVIPTTTLQQGDTVHIGTSEIIPVDGVILTGVAWIQPNGSTDVAAYRLLRVGDRVMAADIVMAGAISIAVTAPILRSSEILGAA